MTGRSFGMLGSTIWQSRRFNRLGSDGARLAFCYVISTDHGNLIGTYRLNPNYMAADRSISTDQAEAELEDMAQVGLIDYDGNERLLHVRRWFSRNKITNRNHLIGAVRTLHELPARSALVGLAASDILFSAFSTAGELDSPDAADSMKNIAAKGCENLVVHHGAEKYFKEISALASIPLCEALSIHLSIALPYPSDTPIDTKREEKRERERDRRGKGRERTRANAKPEAACAPKRAASPNNRQSVVLTAMADHVIAVSKGKAEPASKILPPTNDQLQAMIDKQLISETQRDQFISKGAP